MLSSLYLKIGLSGYRLLGSLFLFLSILNVSSLSLGTAFEKTIWDFFSSLVNDSVSWSGCSKKTFLLLFKPLWSYWIDFPRNNTLFFSVYFLFTFYFTKVWVIVLVLILSHALVYFGWGPPIIHVLDLQCLSSVSLSLQAFLFLLKFIFDLNIFSSFYLLYLLRNFLLCLLTFCSFSFSLHF